MSAPAAGAGAAPTTCDAIDPSHCMFPFPNNRFTVPADTPTGRKLDLPELGMPKNAAGVPVSPLPYNRNDGFSPGQLIVTHVPGLDPARTGLMPIGDMGRAFDAGQPLVVIDAEVEARTLGIRCARRRSIPAARATSPRVGVDPHGPDASETAAA